MADPKLIKKVNEGLRLVAESIYQKELEGVIEVSLRLRQEVRKRGDVVELRKVYWLEEVMIDGVVARDIQRRRNIV